jgi:hypothetical protein
MKHILAALLLLTLIAPASRTGMAQKPRQVFGSNIVASAEIRMEMTPLSQSQRASVVWQFGKQHTKLTIDETKVVAAASILARILVSHAENRREYIERFLRLSRSLLDRSVFKFGKYSLDAGGMSFVI